MLMRRGRISDLELSILASGGGGGVGAAGKRKESTLTAASVGLEVVLDVNDDVEAGDSERGASDFLGRRKSWASSWLCFWRDACRLTTRMTMRKWWMGWRVSAACRHALGFPRGYGVGLFLKRRAVVWFFLDCWSERLLYSCFGLVLFGGVLSSDVRLGYRGGVKRGRRWCTPHSWRFG